jgi:hypothetical protein
MRARDWFGALASFWFGRGRVWLLLPVVLQTTACSQDVVSRTVNSPVVEHRVPVDADAPFVKSDWTFEGKRITGHVTWSSCVNSRSWQTEQQEIVHQTPNPVIAGVMIAGGVALGVVGAATYTTASTQTCSDLFETGGITMCTTREPSNAASQLMITTGVLVIATAVAVLNSHPGDLTRVVQTQAHSATGTEACIPPRDLATLILVLKVGAGKFLHVALGENGDASIDLPEGVHLRPGVDVPIVVYRVPAAAKDLLQRWQVVGVVHTPAAQP